MLFYFYFVYIIFILFYLYGCQNTFPEVQVINLTYLSVMTIKTALMNGIKSVLVYLFKTVTSVRYLYLPCDVTTQIKEALKLSIL